MLTRMAEKQWPSSKKNGQITSGHYINTVVEPRSEIPLALYLFKLKFLPYPLSCNIAGRQGGTLLSSIW